MKKLIILMIVLALAAIAFADIIIGTGTSTGRYPLNDYFVNSRSQCIYLASEINSASGTITHLQWYRSDTGADPNAIGTTEIWLTETTSTTLSTWQTEGTLVATISNIDLGAGGGWFDVDITDFPYNGGNLMVSVRTQNAPYTTPHSYWYYTATTEYRSLLGNSDSDNPPTVSTSYSRPNIKLVGINTTIYPEPTNHVAGFAAGTLSFTSVQLNWTGATGAQLPGNYLIQAKTAAGTFAPVADGTPVANDAVWTDNNAAINVAHVVGANTYTFTGLTANTAYEFKIWPYTNSLADINFKTDGTIPTVNASTLDPTQPLPYTQNFDSGTTLAGINWTGDMYISSTHGTGGSNGLYRNIYSYVATANAVSCPIGPMIANAQLDFDYRIVDYTGYPATGTTLSATDKIEVQISTDGGTTFTTLYTINSANHVTSNAFATKVIELDAYSTGNIYVRFLCTWGAGDYYVDIDNVKVRQTPAAGVLNVSPNPVECGNSFIGYLKNVTVTLSNIGVAPFNLSTIALSNTTNFSLSGLPTLPYTLGVGLSVPITVGFTPTVAGALTTNLLINDTRINSSIVVNGTGVVMPVGEICENPYIITTSPTAYSTNNVGFSNDYISTMFTGVTSSSYLNGLDWVAKLVLPSAKQVNINVADQAGYTSQYLGVYLVGSIPSLASPAAVLGQATAGSGTVTIPTITLAAGTYYIIVDNWPSPVNTYFTLNVTYTDPTPPLPATLVSPTPSGTTGVANTATLNWANGGGGPTGYKLQYGTNAAADNLMSLTDILNVTTYDPAGLFAYGQTYYWKVVPYNGAGDAVIADCPVWSFTVMADPSISSFPYIENFDAVTTPALPTGWTVGEGAAGASYHWKTTTTATHGPAAANSPSNFAWLYCFLASTTYNPYSLITPPIALPVTPKRLAYYYWIGDDTYENPLFVDVSTDNMANWTTLYTHSNLTNTLAWYQNTVDLTDYASQTVYLRFRGVSNYASSMTDFGIDDVLISDFPSGAPEAVTLTYPADTTTDLPVGGFNLTWTPAITGGIPTMYAVFMSQDETTIYDDVYFETTATSLNPTTYADGPSGPVAFAYEDRWYWTVQALNADGDAIVEPAHWFEIEAAPQIITTFPWAENFDLAITPPTDWTVSDVDGGGTAWVGSTTYAHSAPNAFKHGYSTAVDDPGQDGWLITPAIAVPTGNYYLSWWNYNVWPTYLVYNGVKVNTTNDPNAAGWTELWSQDTAASAWSQAVVSISAYAGQTVYFAFNYQGYDADDWYVDDVSVYELTVDTFGPVITHLPILNTPREDLTNTVYADIADDPTWNNPIGGANVYYSLDDGTNWSAAIPMTAGAAPAYTAVLPMFELGTPVTYKIEAWDSLNNMTTTDNYAFTVADPTWIWYDTGAGSYTWFGADQAFSPVVLFNNPFFGTPNAVQVNAVDGMAYDVTASTSVAATLHVYSWDGTGGLANFVDVSGPIAVTLGHTTYQTFDLSTYNIQINTPYFIVSYDLPTGAAFLYDGTYDYGTTYAVMDGTLYTMSNPGAWSIGANVGTGMSLNLPTPVVTIANVAGAPTLSWEIVAGANSYKVYGAADPYAADPWTLLTTVGGLTTSYAYAGTEGMKFFKVVANSDAPARIAATKTNAQIQAPVITLSKLPKANFNLKSNRKK